MDKNITEKTGSDKRLVRIQQLEEKLKKAKQKVKAEALREEKKMYLPAGRVAVKKAKDLNIEISDIEILMGAGKILVEIVKNLDADHAKRFLILVEKHKKIDQNSFLKLKEILTKKCGQTQQGQTPVKKLEDLAKKVEDFKIEPDNEIPY